MIGIVITGHGSFPIGMCESLQIVAGDLKNVRVVPFSNNFHQYLSDLERAVFEVDTGSGVVCFTDLIGCTPFEVCSRLAAENKNIRVIGGTNLPMLLSALFMRGLDLDRFVEKVIRDGKDNMKAFEDKRKTAKSL